MATLADLEAISKKTGISNTGSAGVSLASQKVAQPKVSAGPLDFFKNVAKSAVTIPTDFAKGVGQGIVKGVQDTAGGITEALTAGRQTSVNETYRKSIEDAGTRYGQLYAEGKLSKAAYTKLSQDLIKQSQSLSSDISRQVSTFVTPQDFATGLAGTAALPLAGGKLAVQGAGTVAKIARVFGAGGEQSSLPIAAAKGVIKYPLITQPVAQAPGNIVGDIQSGNVAGAVGNVALLAAPVIAKVVAKGVKAVTPIIKEAAFGKSAILTDTFGRRVEQYAAENPKQVATLKQIEQFTANQAKQGGETQGQTFARYLQDRGVDPKSAPLDDVVANFKTYAKQHFAVQGAIKQGILPEAAVVSADFRTAIPKVAERLKQVTDQPLKEQLAEANKALTDANITNPTIRNIINDGLLNGGSVKDVEALLEHQKAIIPAPAGLLDKGFIATYGPAERAKLPSLSEARSAGLPEFGKAANPVAGAVTDTLKRLGVGLQDYNPAQIGEAKKVFGKTVDGLDIPGVDGKTAYESLSDLTKEARVTDIRQLRVAEIAQKLDISQSDARKVLGAAKDMYSTVPLSVRGAAGKLQDANLKYNPIAATYGRIQSTLRYGANPIFKAQQRIEAATIGQVATGGHAPIGDVSRTVRTMRDEGFLPGSQSYAGEALKDTAGATNVTTHLTPSEENSLARVLQATATKNGRTVNDELKDPKTRELLRAIVQNPKTGFLSSNFAKALNIAVFPTTYNLKVATLAAKALASQPLATQFGVVKNLADFNSYLKTDEGIKWRSQNSELLGLISYFTPINSVQQIVNGVTSGNPANLGLIGGLPFGVIQRVLQGQGIAPQTAPPYLDPKTGELVPDKIPETTKAKLQQGISDILNTMFTYPGRQAGLGSKKDLLNTITGNVLKPAPNETKSVSRTGDVTVGQKNIQRVLAKPVLPKPSATSSTRKLSFGQPKVIPVFTTSKPKRAKTLAKLPGTF